MCCVQFDECHKAKNLMNEQGNPTLTGVAVRHIQDKLPNAAVLYSSATGISEPNNMAYMVRLVKFGHSSMTDLIKSLIESGLGASELFSCSLKAEGIYVARYVIAYHALLLCELFTILEAAMFSEDQVPVPISRLSLLAVLPRFSWVPCCLQAVVLRWSRV